MKHKTQYNFWKEAGVLAKLYLTTLPTVLLIITIFIGPHVAYALNEGDPCTDGTLYNPDQTSCQACGGDLYCKRTSPTSPMGTCWVANGACDQWNTIPTPAGSNCTPVSYSPTSPSEGSCQACPGDNYCAPSGYGSAYGICTPANGICDDYETTYPGACNVSVLGECGPYGGCPWGEMCISDVVGAIGCLPAPNQCPEEPEDFEGERSANPFSVTGAMNLFKETDPGEAANFFQILYRIILPVVIILGMILVVLAGYGIMFSTGDPTKMTISKEKLTSALIGLIFTIFGAAILRVIISSIIGVS